MYSTIFCSALLFASADDHATPRPLDLGALTTIHVDRSDAGDITVLTPRYKMTFDRDGARFVPYFGPGAERTYPLHFDFGGEAHPRLDGSRVTIDRGDFVEVYDLSLDSVEQSFVVRTRPANGDLDFRVPFATELEPAARDATGLRFVAPGLGEVHYSDATILDAAGRRLDTPVVRRGTNIEIVVPDAFADEALFPLTIDPIVSVIPVATGAEITLAPDVVFVNAAIDSYVVAYERQFAANDRDIIARRFTKDGVFQSESVIDAGTANSRHPALATDNGNALIVWREGSDTGSSFTIAARRLVNNTQSLGATFIIASGTAASFEAIPDVGSTAANVPRPYCVTWAQQVAGVGAQIFVVPISDSGSIGASTILGGSGEDLRPSVNQRVGEFGAWLVAYEADATTPNSDIHGALFATSGSLLATHVLGGVTPDQDEVPTVGGDGSELLVAWELDRAVNDQLLVRGFRFSAPNSLVALTPPTDLSNLDHPTGDSSDQRSPAISHDGCRFVVAYDEFVPGVSGQKTFLTTLGVGEGIKILEEHVALSGANAGSDAAVGGAPVGSGAHFVAWTKQEGAGQAEVAGALYSSLSAGSAFVVQTGCGTPEPAMPLLDDLVLGGSSLVVLSNATNPLILIGTQTSLPLCSAQASCTLGVNPIAILPVPLLVEFAVPCNISLLGIPVALQVVDLVAQDAGGPACGPPKFTQRFRVSDTQIVTVR